MCGNPIEDMNQVFSTKVAKEFLVAKEYSGRQGPDPEGFPSELGPAARQRLKLSRIFFKMKEILKVPSLAWPAGRPRQN